MKSILGTRIDSLTDPRAVSIGLVVLMAMLYFWLS
jgi:hypothetical protein